MLISKRKILEYLKNILSNIGTTVSFDFNCYENIDNMKGYIGFITPDGKFYRVRRIGSNDGNHGEWGYYFLEEHSELGIKPELGLQKNVISLVENLGYAYLYESGQNSQENTDPNCPISVYPEFDYLTPKQQEIAEALINYQNNKKHDSVKSL